MVRQEGESSNSFEDDGPSEKIADFLPDDALFDELITWNEILSQTQFYQKDKKPPPKRRKGGHDLELG